MTLENRQQEETMSTELERTQQPQPLPTYKQLFESLGSKFAHILEASARLGLMLGKVLEPDVMRLWAQGLEKYSPQQLAKAFGRAESEIAAWPAVAQLVEFIEREAYLRALAVVLQGLPRHGAEWEDVPARQEANKYDYTGPERVVVPGKIHPAIPAPEIDSQMVSALKSFGQVGTLEAGLRRLLRDHPCFWNGDTEFQTGQHGRQVAMIDRDLYACWLIAKER
jgi:hypothetical protein